MILNIEKSQESKCGFSQFDNKQKNIFIDRLLDTIYNMKKVIEKYSNKGE